VGVDPVALARERVERGVAAGDHDVVRRGRNDAPDALDERLGILERVRQAEALVNAARPVRRGRPGARDDPHSKAIRGKPTTSSDDGSGLAVRDENARSINGHR
jgi:hypothetical protein